jgi:hypothetical protein
MEEIMPDELAPNLDLVHCAGSGSSEGDYDCGMFFTRTKEPKNERRPSCDSCAAVFTSAGKKTYA